MFFFLPPSTLAFPAGLRSTGTAGSSGKPFFFRPTFRWSRSLRPSDLGNSLFPPRPPPPPPTVFRTISFVWVGLGYTVCSLKAGTRSCSSIAVLGFAQQKHPQISFTELPNSVWIWETFSIPRLKAVLLKETTVSLLAFLLELAAWAHLSHRTVGKPSLCRQPPSTHTF